jgi:hypothetical protein
MKKTLLCIIALAIAVPAFAQWTTSGSNIYNSNTGNVGIGTTNPTAGWLQINGSVDLLTLYSNGGVAQFNAYNNSDFRIIQRSNAAMTLWTNTTERMRIDASGNVAIGTTNTSEKFTVSDPNIAVNSSSGVVKILFDSGAGGGALGFEKETFNTGGLRFYTQYGFGSTTEKMRITAEGNIGIGTTTPDALLAVAGTIHTKEVKVDLTGWPDYVFKPTYKLLTLLELKTYIDHNQHLPDMPSEVEVAKNGINLGEMNKLLTKKVEELTLYLIDKDKQLGDQQRKNEQLDARITALEAVLSKLATNK